MRARKSLAGMSAVCLATGSILYICFRPKSLLMFQWAEAIGAGEGVNFAREATNDLAQRLSGWATYSLPFALWVLSYMLAIGAVWEGSRSPAKLAWLGIVPAMAIGSEVAQAAQLIPGNFDWIDLSLLVIASMIGAIAANRHGNASNHMRGIKKLYVGGSTGSIHGTRSRKH